MKSNVPNTVAQIVKGNKAIYLYCVGSELFYEINELGETNSHEYLIKTSTAYIAFDENDELIEALQREIAQLREELLEAQQQIAGVKIKNPST